MRTQDCCRQTLKKARQDKKLDLTPSNITAIRCEECQTLLVLTCLDYRGNFLYKEVEKKHEGLFKKYIR